MKRGNTMHHLLTKFEYAQSLYDDNHHKKFIVYTLYYAFSQIH